MKEVKTVVIEMAEGWASNPLEHHLSIYADIWATNLCGQLQQKREM